VYTVPKYIALVYDNAKKLEYTNKSMQFTLYMLI